MSDIDDKQELLADTKIFLDQVRAYIRWAENIIDAVNDPCPVNASEMIENMENLYIYGLGYDRDEKDAYYEAKDTLKSIASKLRFSQINVGLNEVDNVISNLSAHYNEARGAYDSVRTYRTIPRRSKSVYRKYRR